MPSCMTSEITRAGTLWPLLSPLLSFRVTPVRSMPASVRVCRTHSVTSVVEVPEPSAAAA